MKMRELSHAIHKLLNHYASAEILEKEDMYWFIDNDVMFDLSSVPNEMLVGSIHDDLESLKTLQTTDRVCTSLDLERLAYVLLALARQQQKS